jgi:hypothetical protein
MTTCKGVVKNNVVVLEEGACFPEGAEVEVRLKAPTQGSEDPFARVLANRIHRFVGIDEIIAEDKHEREERPEL